MKMRPRVPPEITTLLDQAPAPFSPHVAAFAAALDAHGDDDGDGCGCGTRVYWLGGEARAVCRAFTIEHKHLLGVFD